MDELTFKKAERLSDEIKRLRHDIEQLDELLESSDRSLRLGRSSFDGFKKERLYKKTPEAVVDGVILQLSNQYHNELVAAVKELEAL